MKYKRNVSRHLLKKNAAFSLIELVVIIAIMAILAALLVPALIHYTEDSRAQKDVTTMDEVVNAVQLALADQDCFDEMELYSCDNNFITYTDSSGKYGQQIIDAEYWAPDGYGKATTITFNPEKAPNGDTIYRLENAIINDITYGNGSIAESRPMTGSQIENNQCFLPNAKLSPSQESGYLYNRIRQTVGNDVITTSATYANSSFTIFIKFSQKDGVTVADVNGAFNGTNLTEGASASLGSGTNSYIDNDESKPEQTQDGGTTNNNYTGSALQGSGSVPGGVSNPNNSLTDYQQPSYIENLQKEHKFEYYSTMYAAAEDLSNNTIGKNADVDKPEAVAGIYKNDGVSYLVLLKDHKTERSIQIDTPTTIILGGNKLSGENLPVIKSSKKIIIDGRIPGSEINARITIVGEKLHAIDAGNGLEIYDGKYTSICENESSSSNAVAVCRSGTAYVKDADFFAQTNARWSTCLRLYPDAYGTINNCNFEAIQLSTKTTGTHCSTGLYIESNADISNCTMTALAKRTYHDEYFEGGIAALVYENNKPTQKVNINNCKMTGTSNGINLDAPADITIKDSYILSGMTAVALQNAKTLKVINCDLIQNLSSFEDHQNHTNNSQASLTIHSTAVTANVYIHNCNMKANQNAIAAKNSPQAASVYISMTTIDKPIIANRPCQIFIGLKNSFTINDVTGNGNKTETNEIYK